MTILSTTAKGLLIAATGAATLVGTAGAANAQSYGYRDRPQATYCDARSSERQVAGGVFGAVGGAVLGSAIAGRGDRNEGAVIGGLLGAVAGSAVARNSGRDCYDDRRGYRDTRYGYGQSYGYAQPYDVRSERRAQRQYEREQRRYERQQARYGYGY